MIRDDYNEKRYDYYKNGGNITIKRITVAIVTMLTHLGVCDKPKACGGVFHLMVNIIIVVDINFVCTEI